jgi:hemolysin-activating ACP:hemolysin acyltransferase
MVAYTVLVTNDNVEYCNQIMPLVKIPQECYGTKVDNNPFGLYHVWAYDEEHAKKIVLDKWHRETKGFTEE